MGGSYLWRFRDRELHRSVTPQPEVLHCNRRALLQHHHVETVAWGGKPATALCLPSVDQRRSMPGREENRMMRGKKETPRQMHHSFKRRAKHADVKINSQTEGERTALSPLPGCHSFSHFLSLKVKVKKPSPLHTSSRTSFTAHIATSFLVYRDSGLKASEATYNFGTL